MTTHHVDPATGDPPDQPAEGWCWCGRAVQQATDHPCRQCAQHCALEAYRRDRQAAPGVVGYAAGVDPARRDPVTGQRPAPAEVDDRVAVLVDRELGRDR